MKFVRAVWEFAQSIVWAVGFALVINTTAIASYYIPSESMVPTLLVGDHLFVSKFPYGYSRYSVIGGPPLFQGRILEQPVARGDAAVFKSPLDNETDIIKRFVGLPGDTIEMRRGVLLINGQAVRKERIADLTYRAPEGAMRTVRRYRETLPEGRSYETVDLGVSLGDNMGPFIVPAGHYFAMGDNRDNSLDSRWPTRVGGLGFVPAENLIGRGEFISWPWSGEARLLEPSTWLHAFRSERALTSLR